MRAHNTKHMTRTLSIAVLSFIATTSFTFAMTPSENRGEMMRNKPDNRTPAVLNVQCIQTAIEKRDTAIITAHGAFNTSIVNALTTRKDALKLSWAKPTNEERKSTRKVALDAFRTSQKGAHEALRTVRKTSWSAFETDMKVCGARNHGEQAQAVQSPTSSL